MLYIHPNIDCGACVPPVRSRRSDVDATPSHQDLIEANAVYRLGDPALMAQAEEIVKAHVAAHADIMAVADAGSELPHARYNP